MNNKNKGKEENSPLRTDDVSDNSVIVEQHPEKVEPKKNLSKPNGSNKLEDILSSLAKTDILLWYTTIITLAFLTYINYKHITNLEFAKGLDNEAFNYSLILMTLFGIAVFVGALLIPYSKIKKYIEDIEKSSTEKYTHKLYTVMLTMVLLLILMGVSVFAILYESFNQRELIAVNSELLIAFYILAIIVFLSSLICAFRRIVLEKKEKKPSKKKSTISSILIIIAFVVIPFAIYIVAYRIEGTHVSVSPMGIMGLGILIVTSIFLSDLTVRGFIKHLKENGDRDKRRIYILWYFVIIILLGLLFISVSSVLRSDNSVALSSESTASILLTGLGIFIAGSIFFPQFTMERLVNDKIDSVRRRVGAEMTEKVDKSEETLKDLEHELLKLEAHECRMNAFFLYKQKEYGWSIGWILKAIYKYEVLLERHPMDDRYDTLVKDLIWLSKEVFCIIEKNIKAKGVQSETDDNKRIRASYLYVGEKNTKIDIDTISRKEQERRGLTKVEKVNEDEDFRVSIRQYDIRTRYVRYFKIILKYIDLELYKYQIRGALRESFEAGKSIFKSFIIGEEISYIFDKYRKESSKSDIQQIFEDFKKYPKCQEALSKYFKHGLNRNDGFKNMEGFLNELIKRAE